MRIRGLAVINDTPRAQGVLPLRRLASQSLAFQKVKAAEGRLSGS